MQHALHDGDRDDVLREELSYGIVAVLQMRDDGNLKITLFEEVEDGPDDYRIAYTGVHPPDVTQKIQTQREIANSFAQKVTHTDSEFAKQEVKDFFHQLNKDAGSVDLSHPEVSEILESTDKVEIWDGNPTTVTVKLTYGGKFGKLEFTEEEFSSDSCRTLKPKFFSEFHTTPKVGNDDWIAIRDVWEQRASVAGQTGVNDDELVAREVLNALKRRVEPKGDRDALDAGNQTAFFDVDNEHEFGGVQADGDVLWVQSSLVKSAIETVGETRKELGMVSRKLQEDRAMYGSPTPIRVGEDRNHVRCWPLDPMMVSVSKEFVEGLDEDEDDDDDPEEGATGGPDDGDGDDPDDSDALDTPDDQEPGDDDRSATANTDTDTDTDTDTAPDSSEPTSITDDPDADDDLDVDVVDHSHGGTGGDDDRDEDPDDATDAVDQTELKPGGDGSNADVADEISTIEDGPKDGDPMTDGGVPTMPSGGDQPGESAPEVTEVDPFDHDEWNVLEDYDGDTDVYRVFGAPGAGKTRELKRAIHREVREFDKTHDDILFCTFTRSGRSEAEDDLVRIFDPTDEGTEDEVRRRAKTVHGATLRAAVQQGLIDPPDDVHLADVILYNQSTDTEMYQAFADEEMLPFEKDITNPIRMTKQEMTDLKAANAVFSIYSWLKLNRLDLKKFPRAPVDCPLGQRKTYEKLQAWEAFKKDGLDYRVYEHVDYIDLAIENAAVPNASVLLLDEFQDLSPQEYALYEVWRDSGLFDRIYIAGDRNQSIYSFRGGDPTNFIETDVTYQKSVGESWRCPEPVVDVATSIMNDAPDDDPNTFSAVFEDGVAERVSLPENRHVAEAVQDSVVVDADAGEFQQVYLLARTNYQVGRICGALNDGGIPFKGITDNMDPWNGDLVCALHVVRALRDDRPVPAEPLDYLLNGRLQAHEKRETNLRLQVGQGDAETYPPSAVWEAFNDCDRLEDIAGPIKGITDYQESMLASAIESDAPIDPNYVRVGTIHASKGSEAPVVYLFNSESKRIFESTIDDDDRYAEEFRVAYVGATRASSELYVVDDYFDSTYTMTGVPGGASL